MISQGVTPVANGTIAKQQNIVIQTFSVTTGTSNFKGYYYVDFELDYPTSNLIGIVIDGVLANVPTIAFGLNLHLPNTVRIMCVDSNATVTGKITFLL